MQFDSNDFSVQPKKMAIAYSLMVGLLILIALPMMWTKWFHSSLAGRVFERIQRFLRFVSK